MTQIQDEQALLPCPWCGSGDDPKLDIFHTMPSGEQSIAVTCMDCGGRGPVTIEPYRGECESEWNTRSLPALIAAAPTMLAACVAVIEDACSAGCVTAGTLILVRDAIAKAKGD